MLRIIWKTPLTRRHCWLIILASQKQKLGLWFLKLVSIMLSGWWPMRPFRGWLLVCAGLRSDIRWAELGSKGLNRLVNTLIADPYQVDGRCRFKDEFVTAGGVSATEVNPNTLESKHFPGLYFAGEVLDIDAITGGFNLQAAWSTAYTVARAVGR